MTNPTAFRLKFAYAMYVISREADHWNVNLHKLPRPGETIRSTAGGELVATLATRSAAVNVVMDREDDTRFGVGAADASYLVEGRSGELFLYQWDAIQGWLFVNTFTDRPSAVNGALLRTPTDVPEAVR